jgi:CSLREA domain-containing protein
MGVLGAGIGFAPATDAASIIVNNLSGTSVGGQCTLRDAIQAANTDLAVQGCTAGSGADVITFSVTGTISLASQINIYSNVTITGPGAGSLTITPTGSNRSLFITNGPVVITDITFANANSDIDGAQIGMKATAGSTAVTLTNDVFNNNINGQDGGALFLYLGGAIDITNCTFTGNTSGGRGGAIKLYKVGPVTITDTTISGNTSQTAAGTGRGGGIFLYKTTGVTISSSTISGNNASFAGSGLFFYKTTGASTISDSTISGNTANRNNPSYGGAVFLYTSTVTITNSTINGNTTNGTNSGGIGVHDGSTLNLVSSIVANSTATGNTFDIASFGGAASTVNADHSLIKNAGAAINGTNTANITGQDPNLGPLANNGGPTLTLALLGGSPAIDTGSNPSALANDQRGAGFPRTVGAGTDIGAFEVQGAAPPPTITSVPALAPAGLAALSALLGGLGLGRLRRRRQGSDA